MKWLVQSDMAPSVGSVGRRRTNLFNLFGSRHAAIATFLVCALPALSSAQTAEDLAKKYGREVMEQALSTKDKYDLYGLHFDFDKATLQPDAKPLLDDIALTLAHFPAWRLVIVGHTDTTGDAAHNELLSLERADAIKAALVERGIAQWRLETVGAGQTAPVATNDTAEGQALNRRVELTKLESEPANLLKGMSDYVKSQAAISFTYDANLEVVTGEKQKLDLASSGTLALRRPDLLRTTRTGGFADLESTFDGKTLSILGKNMNAYTRIAIPGDLDNLINQLKDTYNRPLPAADLLLSDPFTALMADVVDVKDLGSGVVGGMECDHLAFRNKDVDWQIWISQGSNPRPCRYVITTTAMQGSPEYSIQIGNWKTGVEVTDKNFEFQPPQGAQQIDPHDLKDLKEASDLPDNFKLGEVQ